MVKTTIESTSKVFGTNKFKGNFGSRQFPMHPISPEEGAYASSITLIETGKKVDIALYFYTDSAIIASDISLYYEGNHLYVSIDKAQNPTPTNVTLWKLTANISNTPSIFTDGESIELYCKNPAYAIGDTDGPTTSRGTKVSVKSGTGEV